jgi:hypothetical protein
MVGESERDVAQELSLADEDRLPWLEAVDSDEPEPGVDTGKILGFVIAALLALGVIVGGIWWLRNQEQTPNGDGRLIAAAEGDYKVKPDETGGMKVEGQGDAAFAASEGADANGKMDVANQPETPIDGQRVTEVKPAAPVASGPKASASVQTGGKLVAPAPTVPAPKPVVAPPAGTPAAIGTGLIQLGAYASEASANQAWNALAQRYAFLGTLPKSVVQASVGGTTFYRLRVGAGAQASDTCAKLKAGGANCIVVK